MSKLTEKMFGKNVKTTFNFVDLDAGNKVLDTEEISGKAGQEIEYDPQEKINQLIDQGYALADKEFSKRANKNFGQEDQTLPIAFHHAHLKVTAANPSHGYSKDQLEKKIQQIIHYQGAASRTPENSVTEVVFEREVEIDQVTDQVASDSGWQPEKQSFMIIGTPTLPGFIPDQAAAGGDSVTAEDGNKEYTVNFEINKVPSSLTQSAIVRFVDINNGNKAISVDKLSGQPNMPIEYDPKNKINHLENEGFKLIHNGFNGDGDIQFFGNADSYEPIFIITMKYTAVAVNKDHPNDAIDPSQYEKESKFTVEFLGAGDATPAKVVQTAHWSRTVTVIPDKNQIIANGFYDTPWKADLDHYNNVTIPVVDGYHSKGNVVNAIPVTEKDQLLTVTYEENGHIIPVDENGTTIPNAPHPQFENDPHQAGEVRDDQIIPDVEGYKCDLMTVTPDDPGKDLQVSYKSVKKEDTLYINLGKNKTETTATPTPEPTMPTAAPQGPADAQPTVPPMVKPEQTEGAQAKEATQPTVAAASAMPTQPTEQATTAPTQPAQQTKQQVAIVNFIDVDHNGASLTSSGPLVGQPGESINDLYSTEIPLKVIKKAGYHVVFNNFDSDGFVQRFDNNDLLTQVFTIGVSKKKPEEAKKELIPVSEDNGSSAMADGDVDPKVAALKETTDQLKKIKPTLLPKDNGDNSQTVTRLLDIVTALLNLIFVLGNGDKKDK